MLGLCWSPSAVQSMHKMATTVPSNPEQLLGAILVRKDIFHRFESTMNDTCLDANNLLEYLFSLYNSTAVPAERENSSGQNTGMMMPRDGNLKRPAGRIPPIYPNHQTNNIGSHLSQPVHPSCRQPPEVPRVPLPVLSPGSYRKKIKLEQSNNLSQHQHFPQSASTRLHQNNVPVFPSGINNSSVASSCKMEPSADMEQLRVPTSSPLPPISQIRHHHNHHGNKAYSPAMMQYTNALNAPAATDGRSEGVVLNVGVDSSGGNVKTEVVGAMQGITGNVLRNKGFHGHQRHSKKSKLKGSGGQQAEFNSGSRRKKSHECFCGALFTRADNLKRHVRKCHEEKLEKLNSAPLSFEDTNNVPVAAEFPQVVSAPCPETGGDPGQVQAEHTDNMFQQQNGEVIKPGGVRWCCFCGRTFDSHMELTEHARTHENS